MQVIEKVKVVPEGYNGAGMDGYGRRDVNGKANAGLTLGIIGTALGAWALFGNRRSAGVLGTGAGLMGDGSTNINVVGAGMGSAGAPTAFQAWSKSCEDTLALQGGLYQWALTQQNQRFQDRQVIDSEMFGLYKSQIDADFLLYKGNRDNYDSLKAEISELKTQVAVSAAIRPYQDKLIQCESRERSPQVSIMSIKRLVMLSMVLLVYLMSLLQQVLLVEMPMVVYRADLLKLLVLLLHNITNQLKNKLCYLLIKLYWAEQTLC